LAVYARIRQSLPVDLTAVPGTARAAPDAAPLPIEYIGAALENLRAVVGSATYPGELPSAGPAREGARTLAAQLDDYLIPRLRRIDAPLLAVVGGSTGAGKSTLVNSLVRSPVSAAGVLRPTTRGPVLVCHPADGAWFGERSLLSGLARSNRPGESQLQVVSAPLLRPGLALLDAPDIDSVVAANRDVAQELLAAADLWLFVTTAARYADAVPWAVLRGARDRGTVVAVVLDRVPPEARDEIAADFARMLREQDLGAAPLFVVLESTLDGFGMLGELAVAPLKTWLDTVASNSSQRQGVTRRTLLGAVAAASIRAEALAQAADDQTRAAATVAAIAREAYGRAMSDVEAHVRSGAVLRGEVYARWQEAVASGELGKAVRAAEEPRRTRAEADGVTPAAGLQAAIAGALAALVVEVDLAAAEVTGSRWRPEPLGRELLAADESLGRPWPGFADAAHDLVHGWQTWVRTRAYADAPPARTGNVAPGTGVTALLATIAAVAPPATEITAEPPAMLRAVVSNPGAVALGERARAEFLVRVGELLAAEVDRRLTAISRVGVDSGLAARLREGAAQVGVARHDVTVMSEAA
jgi:hypothetical protein